MVWVKLDDGFPDHPKIDPLSDGAFRLLVTAMCHSARCLTDGFIPAERVERLVPRFRRAWVAELVGAGRFEEVEGGWVIHNFVRYQPTKAQVESERAATAERQQRWRDRHRSNGVTPPVTNGATEGVTNGCPDPTRPVTRTGGSSTSSRAGPDDPRSAAQEAQFARNAERLGQPVDAVVGDEAARLAQEARVAAKRRADDG